MMIGVMCVLMTWINDNDLAKSPKSSMNMLITTHTARIPNALFKNSCSIFNHSYFNEFYIGFDYLSNIYHSFSVITIILQQLTVWNAINQLFIRLILTKIFIKKYSSQSKQIYCIQPYVISIRVPSHLILLLRMPLLWGKNHF